MKESPINGLLVLDKPGGMTSRDALNRAAGWFPPGTRLGHTGTLDPLATGVLVLCLGSATRLAEYVQEMDKVYRAGILLGARSDTDDAEGAITPVAVADPPGRAAIDRLLPELVGAIEQTPPDYSAIRVSGQRAYKLARKGKPLALAPRRVNIYAIALLDFAYPHLDVEVHCGKGTYIRSLARDLGERLGAGGLLAALRRLRVGPFRVEDAISLDAEPEAARRCLLPIVAALPNLPQMTLPDDALEKLRHGQPIPLASMPRDKPSAAEAAILNESGELAAVCRIDHEAGLLLPHKVFSPQGVS